MRVPSWPSVRRWATVVTDATLIVAVAPLLGSVMVIVPAVPASTVSVADVADATVCAVIAAPLPVVEIVRPDIYVKGGDYDMDNIEEARLVRSWGGTALALPFVPGHSTTGTVSRLRDAK